VIEWLVMRYQIGDWRTLLEALLVLHEGRSCLLSARALGRQQGCETRRRSVECLVAARGYAQWGEVGEGTALTDMHGGT